VGCHQLGEIVVHIIESVENDLGIGDSISLTALIHCHLD
jgi:hypothetical protein